MVVFTCNHCGESLQKPRVEKHYQTSCRNVISVTCMDCFKDFKLQEYVGHTKCITEEQRYSAKGSVPDGAKKGEMKQQSWVAQINAIIETQKDLKPNERSILEVIAKNDNVPRKRAKFINFMKSTTGGRVNQQDIEAVWNILEAQKKKDQESKQAETKKETTTDDPQPETDLNAEKKSKKNKKKTESDSEKPESEAKPAENGENPSKKKKKRKAGEAVETEAKKAKPEENGSEEKANDDKLSKKQKRKLQNDEGKETVIEAEVPKKKKKNKKGQEEATPVEETKTEEPKPEEGKKKKNKNQKEQMVEETVVETNGVEEKKKKNKKQKETVEETVVETKELTETNGVEKKKKNKKQKEVPEVNGEVKEETPVMNGDGKKKKKQKDAKEEVVENAENGKKGNAEKADTNGKPANLNESFPADCFHWAQVVLEVVKEKAPISKDDLQKEVTKRYVDWKGESPTPKQLKNYHRKLRKINDVKLENDMYTMLDK